MIKWVSPDIKRTSPLKKINISPTIFYFFILLDFEIAITFDPMKPETLDLDQNVHLGKLYNFCVEKFVEK